MHSMTQNSQKGAQLLLLLMVILFQIFLSKQAGNWLPDDMESVGSVYEAKKSVKRKT